MSDVYDVIVIGGGPSGLMTALTAVGGMPINPPRHFRGLLLDKDVVGEFARYGRLRLTHQWFLLGRQLIRDLEAEAVQAGIQLKSHEEVVAVDLTSSPKTVTTGARTYRGHTVAVCTGFFPHGSLFRHARCVRVMFSPPDMEHRALPAGSGYEVGVLGAGPSVLRAVRRFSELRPDLSFSALSETPVEGNPDHGVCVLSRLQAVEEDARGVRISATGEDGHSLSLEFRFLLVDYNSYTTWTGATGFLASEPLVSSNGYLAVDGYGNTDIPGVVASGNIVTPVSGALTALSSGFTAGLSLFSQLYESRFGEKPFLYPWLPAEGLGAHPLHSHFWKGPA